MKTVSHAGTPATPTPAVVAYNFRWNTGGASPLRVPALSTALSDEVRRWGADVARATSRRHGVEHHAMLTAKRPDPPTLVARRAFVRSLVSNGWPPVVIERHFGMPRGSASPTLVVPAHGPTPAVGLTSCRLPGLVGEPLPPVVHRDLKPSNLLLSRKPLPVHKAERVIPAGPRPPFAEARSKRSPQPKCGERRFGVRCRHDAVEDGRCVAHALQHRAAPPPLDVRRSGPTGKRAGT